MAGLLLVGISGCGKPADDRVQTESDKARDEFVKSLEDTVDSLQDNMVKLGVAAAAKGGEAKTMYDAEVKPELEQKLEQARNALSKVKAQSGSTWESMKDVANASVDELKNAYDKAVSKLE